MRLERRKTAVMACAMTSVVVFATNTAGASSPQLRAAIERVSVSSSGRQGNGDSSGPGISGDGNDIAFTSTATNLVPNGVAGLYLHDRAAHSTVFIAPGGTSPSLSLHGRFVAFTSGAANIVPGVTGTQVYVRDRILGTTALASVAPGGAAGNAPSDHASVSSDGHLVAFSSTATNLDPANPRTESVYVRNLTTGVTTSIAPLTPSGTWMEQPTLSADGSTLAYTSHTTPESCQGYPGLSSISRVKLNHPVPGSIGCGFGPTLSGDGHIVGYASAWAVIDGPNAGCIAGFYLFDGRSGQTHYVSSYGRAPGVISADGLHVVTPECPGSGVGVGSGPNPAFPLLTVPGTGGGGDLTEWYLNYQGTGALLGPPPGPPASPLTASFASEADYSNFPNNPAISADGQVTAFDTPGSDLVAGDTNHASDVFVNVTGVLTPLI